MNEHRSRDLERGPKGDHGQTGSRGLRGDPAPPVMSWLVAAVVVALIFVATAVVTYKQGKAAADAKAAANKAKQQAIAACQGSNKNSRAINAGLELQALRDPAHAHDYRALRVTILNCQ